MFNFNDKWPCRLRNHTKLKKSAIELKEQNIDVSQIQTTLINDHSNTEIFYVSLIVFNRNKSMSVFLEEIDNLFGCLFCQIIIKLRSIVIPSCQNHNVLLVRLYNHRLQTKLSCEWQVFNFAFSTFQYYTW